MSKTLKVWNGRGYCARKFGDPKWEGKNGGEVCVNVCAYSRADAIRVIEAYCGRAPSVTELRDYFSPCWGNAMKGIKPERGLWLEWDCYSTHSKTEKVYPLSEEDDHE
jgi:hypothetical protein